SADGESEIANNTCATCHYQSIILGAAGTHHAFARKKSNGEIGGINQTEVLKIDGECKCLAGISCPIRGSAALGGYKRALGRNKRNDSACAVINHQGKVLVKLRLVIRNAVGIDIGSRDRDGKAATYSGRQENAFGIDLGISGTACH